LKSRHSAAIAVPLAWKSLHPDFIKITGMENVKEFNAVKFDQYGGLDVLHLEKVPLPAPGQGEALVKVKAAGINPGESAIREGLMAKQWPATFPSGQGSDFAGVVEQLGSGVTALQAASAALSSSSRAISAQP
jgi:D-arabinose 1-dehydrogenase-like Zn-dependent alcohol dehydrogenase